MLKPTTKGFKPGEQWVVGLGRHLGAWGFPGMFPGLSRHLRLQLYNLLFFLKEINHSGQKESLSAQLSHNLGVHNTTNRATEPTPSIYILPVRKRTIHQLL